MRSLHTPGEMDRLKVRLSRVQPDTSRRWGRMSAHQMICHLSDAFRFALGEREGTPVRFPLPPGVVRFVALRLPLPWPKGAPTMREMDQSLEGTPPRDFLADREELAALMDRFAAATGGWPPHPVMGKMSRQDWSRWGYLHADHHLRQFGA